MAKISRYTGQQNISEDSAMAGSLSGQRRNTKLVSNQKDKVWGAMQNAANQAVDIGLRMREAEVSTAVNKKSVELANQMQNVLTEFNQNKDIKAMDATQANYENEYRRLLDPVADSIAAIEDPSVRKRVQAIYDSKEIDLRTKVQTIRYNRQTEQNDNTFVLAITSDADEFLNGNANALANARLRFESQIGLKFSSKEEMELAYDKWRDDLALKMFKQNSEQSPIAFFKSMQENPPEWFTKLPEHQQESLIQIAETAKIKEEDRLETEANRNATQFKFDYEDFKTQLENGEEPDPQTQQGAMNYINSGTPAQRANRAREVNVSLAIGNQHQQVQSMSYPELQRDETFDASGPNASSRKKIFDARQTAKKKILKEYDENFLTATLKYRPDVITTVDENGNAYIDINKVVALQRAEGVSPEDIVVMTDETASDIAIELNTVGETEVIQRLNELSDSYGKNYEIALDQMSKHGLSGGIRLVGMANSRSVAQKTLQAVRRDKGELSNALAGRNKTKNDIYKELEKNDIWKQLNEYLRAKNVVFNTSQWRQIKEGIVLTAAEYYLESNDLTKSMDMVVEDYITKNYEFVDSGNMKLIVPKRFDPDRIENRIDNFSFSYENLWVPATMKEVQAEQIRKYKKYTYWTSNSNNTAAVLTYIGPDGKKFYHKDAEGNYITIPF